MVRLSVSNVTIISVAVACFLAPEVNAQSFLGFDSDRRYLSLSGAFVSPRDSSVNARAGSLRGGAITGGEIEGDNGFSFTGALGFGMSGDFDIEAEIGYRSYDTETLAGANQRSQLSGDVSTLSLMANALYSFESMGAQGFVPLAGGGVGFARHSVDANGTSYSDTVLAYQAIFGAQMPVSDDMSIRFGYRYFATGKAKFNGWDASYGTHNFEVGAVFSF